MSETPAGQLSLLSLRTRVLPFFRFGMAGLLGPGVSKFVTYERLVAFFASLGLPSPAVLVVVVVAKLLAATLLVMDRAPRAAALLAAPIMPVAVLTAGPSWQNVGVLAAAAIVLGSDRRMMEMVR